MMIHEVANVSSALVMPYELVLRADRALRTPGQPCKCDAAKVHGTPQARIQR
jgi:hypothetical protein